MTTEQTAAARLFRRLHGEGLLILTNAWDAGSARLIESLGAKALATTSAGVAWSHGYADGHHLPVSLLVATVEASARGARTPITADVDAGYSGDPADNGDAGARGIAAGPAGSD